MIRNDRATVAVPESLSEVGESKGRAEEAAIIQQYAAYLQLPPGDRKFTFSFQAYRSSDVKVALAQLFRGKCAYCESRYAGTQPMDVEHFRPKGGVEEIVDGKRVLLDGYPWLAARWSNLLPSCIDCNRQRLQHDALTGLDEKLGKANQFPVTGPRMLPPKPGEMASPVPDAPLILDPTVDNPAEHLRFRTDGVVTATSEKGRQSIRVYALNRADLVFERLGLARLIEQRLTIIEALARIIARPTLSESVRLDLQDLTSYEIDALMSLADPGQPFSAMARQLIAESAPASLVTPAPAAALPEGVARMLTQFSPGEGPNAHLLLASHLTSLGYQSHLPTTARYVRWTIRGTARRVTLYQEPVGLVSRSKTQFTFARGLAGGVVQAQRVSPYVRYPVTATTLETTTTVVTRFRGWADALDT